MTLNLRISCSVRVVRALDRGWLAWMRGTGGVGMPSAMSDLQWLLRFQRVCLWRAEFARVDSLGGKNDQVKRSDSFFGGCPCYSHRGRIWSDANGVGAL